ncbi:hypothetical protein [Planococcus lenghuensis]|uniref:Uncharacterized protein n=1 Tax=Planococcus lenghuensis TaxID=2213202 RepID=A0A1Q2KY10_9BACL|nr:hypothetical protein [Planococcus lenghuensis]AQQ53100.1 hypothetical protein B0X71_08330 [Planococcus lenghuensis]
MVWVAVFGLLTVVSVMLGIKKRKAAFFLMPLGAIFTFMLVKIILVPLPFTDTVRFIFSLQG